MIDARGGQAVRAYERGLGAEREPCPSRFEKLNLVIYYLLRAGSHGYGVLVTNGLLSFLQII